MLPKNLTIYTFNKPVAELDHSTYADADALHNALLKKQFTDCTASQRESTGWVTPLGKNSTAYTHQSGGFILVTMATQERILPASVIREELDERVEAIQDTENRRVGSKEKKEIRERIEDELLPRAFTRTTKLDAWIDTAAGQLIINTPSRAKAEALATLLRKTIGSCPVEPLKTQPVTANLTEYLATYKLPEPFEFGDECELTSPGEDRSVAAFRKHQLGTEEVKSNIAAGKTVSKLSLIWDGKISFTIDSDLVIKKIKFLDILQERMDKEDPQTHEERLDIEFTLMAGEISNLLKALLPALDATSSDEMDDENAGLIPDPRSVDQSTAVIRTFQIPSKEMEELIGQLTLQDALFSTSHSERVVTIIFADQEDCDHWMNHFQFVNKKLLNEYVVKEQA